MPREPAPYFSPPALGLVPSLPLSRLECATLLPLASLPAHQRHHESRSMRSRWTKTATSLHLGETAIHEQLCSRDEAAVVGCEKHHGLRDLVGRTAPAERHRAGDRLGALLARFRGTQELIQSGRIGRARADRVDANVAVLQVRCPRPCERTHGGLGGAVHTVRRESLAADDGRVQDDRGTIRQQRQRLLHGEQDAPYVDVEDRVVELFTDRPQGAIPRNAGIREHDDDPALPPLYLRKQATEL